MKLHDELQELADELRDSIDGGDECRARDQRISRQIELIERAMYAVKERDRLGSILHSLSERVANGKLL